MAQEIRDHFDELEGQEVTIAGRMMSRRIMGKASFADVADGSGRIQVYLRIVEMGEEAYKATKTSWDVGDIVGITGHVFRTKRGEISVKATAGKLLSKSLRPLPEKFHGLQSTDLRYRQRYLDLIMNPDVRRTFVLRSQFIKYVRKFLDDRGYIEVETPVLNTISGGATARPFVTHHNTLDIDMYPAHRDGTAVKAPDCPAAWSACMRLAAFSATRAWTRSTTRNSRVWNCTRRTRILTT